VKKGTKDLKILVVFLEWRWSTSCIKEKKTPSS